MIEELTLGITEKLQEIFPTYEVIHFPDLPENYQCSHPTAALLVRYEGGTYENRLSVNGKQSQKGVTTFGITVVCKEIVGDDGIYRVVDGVKNALFALKPECGEPFTLKSDGFKIRKDQFYYYTVIVETRLLLMEE